MDKTLLKGLAVLEAITDMQAEARMIDDIAAHVGLTRSNTHRTLQTLTHAGYIERDGMNGGYRGTTKMFALGLRQFGGLDVRRTAPPYMATIATETGESVHLSVLDGLDVIYVDKIDSVQPVQAYTMVGGRAPAHAVATGKALLSAQGPSYIDTLPSELPHFTPTTIVDLRLLREELAQAARVGYAVNRGEWRDSVGGIASPIFNALGRPVAALGISGPLQRLSIDRMTAFAPRVVDTAAQISAALGYRRGHFGESL